MPPNLWGFLVLVSGILFWLTDHRFRYLGLAGLLVLFALFRRGDHWLAFGYWEILGIIGWTYLRGLPGLHPDPPLEVCTPLLAGCLLRV